MRLLEPVVADPRAPLARTNPLGRLGAALLLMVVLFVSLDALTATLVLVVLAAAIPLSGLSFRVVLMRFWPILAIAGSIGLINVLAAAEQLGPAVQIGPVALGGETLMAGVSLALRLLAIALAGIVAVAGTDPTELSDALIGQLRVPPRFAIGALAAYRLLPLLAFEWQTMALARRARGLDAGGSPIAALRIVAGLLLGLLVAAIRRGSRLAMAMEARGFEARPCRTIARPTVMRAGDWALIGGAAAVGVAAAATSVLLGTHRPIFG
jgi:energy-coupling factor transport system permease protein